MAFSQSVFVPGESLAPASPGRHPAPPQRARLTHASHRAFWYYLNKTVKSQARSACGQHRMCHKPTTRATISVSTIAGERSSENSHPHPHPALTARQPPSPYPRRNAEASTLLTPPRSDTEELTAVTGLSRREESSARLRSPRPLGNVPEAHAFSGKKVHSTEAKGRKGGGRKEK